MTLDEFMAQGAPAASPPTSAAPAGGVPYADFMAAKPADTTPATAEPPSTATAKERPWARTPYVVGRGAIAGGLGSFADFGNLVLGTAAMPFGGRPIEKPVLGSEWIGERLDEVQNAWDSLIGGPKLAGAPEGAGEHITHAIGSGVGSVVSPLAAIKTIGKAAPELGRQIENSRATGALTNFFKKPTAATVATETGLGGVSGAGAGVGAEAAPGNPLAPLIGGILAPLTLVGGAGALSQAARGARKVAAPLTEPGQREIAGQVLRESALEPGAVTSVPEPPPITGMRPTLGQQTGDPGIIATEQAAATINPAPFVARRSENNQVIRQAAEGASEGDPAAIAAEVERRRLALTAAADRGAGRAASGTEEAVTAAAPTGAGKGQASEALHGEIMARHAASETAEREAWAPINAVQGLTFDTAPIKAATDAALKGLTRSERALLPEGEIGILKDWGGAEPFAELTTLKSAVGSARAEASRAGNANKARVIGKLEKVLAEALDNPALIEDSLPGEPSIRDAYANARRVTREQKQQFNTDTETEALFRQTGTGDVRVAPTETMARFVKPGPGGKEAFESLVTALGGPQVLERAAAGEATALNHVRDWAMADLQAKPLTAKSLAAWRDRYAGMVDAFPPLRSDLDAIGQRVARQEQVVQRRQQLVDMLEKNAANKFAEGDPEWALGQLLKSKNLQANDQQVSQFLRFIKKSPEAQEGARQTMVDMLMHSGDPKSGGAFLSSPAMAKFYEQNGRVFDTLFPDKTQREMVDRIVKGVRMNGEAGAGVHATSGPNTAQKLAGVERLKKLSGDKYIDGLVGGRLDQILSLAGGAAGAAVGSTHGPVGTAAGMAVGSKLSDLPKRIYAKPREKIMDLVNEALRDPTLARDLMRDVTPRNDKIVGPRLVRYLGGTAVPAKAAADEGED